MSITTRRLLLAALGIVLSATFVWAQTKGAKAVRRAQPPKFGPADGTFYADAFKDGLVGERPGDLSAPVAVAGTTSSAPAAGSSSGGLAGSGWSGIISATTVEDEIKALKKLLDTEVTTPSDFAGKGYKVARRDFSMLAMLFAIVGEYDGDVRWKKDGPAARDVFGRTAANAKVGTPQVFQEAKLRKQELEDLVGGSSPYADKGGEAKATWNAVCDRSPLMQHLEAVWEPRLKPLLSDKGQFTANADKVLHDAEVLAAIGAVLAKEGMQDADSDEYKAFCLQLQKSAQQIAEAVRLKNYDQAAAASSALGKSCTDCHENYRA